MKTTYCFLASASLLLASSSLSTAEPISVTTDPVGYVTFEVPADSLVYFGLVVHAEPVFQGQISSIDGDQLSFDDADFSSILHDSVYYSLELNTSVNEGLSTLVEPISAETVVTDQDLSAFLSVGDLIVIRPLRTISEIFGEGDELVLNPGSATTGDLVYVPSFDGAGQKILYYSLGGGFLTEGWKAAGEGNADYSNTPIYTTDGLQIRMKGFEPVTVTQVGSVKMSDTLLAVETGFNVFSFIYPAGMTLGESGLYDPNNPGNSVTPGTATTADIIYFDSNGDGSLELYYYTTGGGFLSEGWKQAGQGNTDMSGIELPDAFGIKRRGAATNIFIFKPFALVY